MTDLRDSQEIIWLAQAQRGDSHAFAMLVELYQRPVFNLCYRMLNDPEEAEDASQETFLRAFDHLRKYDASWPFSTWLLSIAAHYCIDQIRKRRMVVVSLDGAPYLDPPDLGPGPEMAVSQSEVQSRIERLLMSLSPQDRAAVIMFYWYEFSYEEIAVALNLTVSAVKSRLHRARSALAKTWNEQEAQISTKERIDNGKAHSPAFQ